MIHGESGLALGKAAGDIDIVVGVEPAFVFTALRPGLARLGLSPIIWYPYDAGGSSTVFLATAAARDGVQLDLFYDPRGVGRFGIRSDRLLDHVVRGQRWPTIDEAYRLAYLIRKRAWKAEGWRLAHLTAEAQKVPQRDWRRVIREICSDDVATWYLEGADPARFRRPRASYPYELRRLVNRLLRPIGCWVSTEESPHIVSRVADRFNRILPLARFVPAARGRLRDLDWYRKQIAPIRWRPGLAITTNVDGRVLLPDVSLGAYGTEDGMSEAAVTALAHRATRRVIDRISG